MRMSTTLADAWHTGRNNFNLIRLVAAWLVIWSHGWPITGTAGPDPLGRLTLIRSGGEIAVDVFFVVSGFLVAASLERNRWREFLAARALRIFPALIVCVLLTVFVLGPALTTASDYWSSAVTWRYLWANASLWRAEFSLPGVFATLPRDAVNGSLWTLPIEGRLYLALLLAGILGMLRPLRYLPTWALAIAAACGFAWLRAPLPEHLSALIWVTAFFITGTLIWIWRARIRLSTWALLPLLAMAAATRGSVWFAPAYFALVAYGTFCAAFLPRLPVIARTDLSYGLYLYGWPMQQLALLAGATTVLTNTAVASTLAFVCAAGSWYLVERPALNWKRRLLATSPAAATDAAEHGGMADSAGS